MSINKRAVLLLILCLGIICLGGCETAIGAAKGMGYTLEGAAHDTCNTYNFISHLDKWMQRNLW